MLTIDPKSEKTALVHKYILGACFAIGILVL